METEQVGSNYSINLQLQEDVGRSYPDKEMKADLKHVLLQDTTSNHISGVYGNGASVPG